MHVQTPRSFCLAALATLSLSTIALLGTRANAQVTDGAGFFSPDAVQKADSVISDIQRQTRRKVIVETFPTLPANVAGSYSKDREAQFYESWIQDRGKATGSDIHVLALKSPPHLEIGASSETRRHDFAPADHQAASRVMLDGFRAKQYDEALLSTLREIQTRVVRNQASGASAAPVGQASPPMGGTGSPAQAPGNPARRTSGGICGGGGIGGWLCLGVGVILVLFIVRRIMGRRGGGGPPTGMGGGYGNQPGYGPGVGQQSGGGGFGRGMLGGLLGGVLGGAAYDHFRGGNQAGASPMDPNAGAGGMLPPDDVSSGGNFGTDTSSDFSSGGDFGGGDSGGGGGDVSSGGDF